MRLLISVVVLISVFIGIFGAVALTEFGQILDMPRPWVFTYFDYKSVFSVAILFAVVLVFYLDNTPRFFSKKLKVCYALGIIACVFFINFFAPDFWLRSQHYGAQFMSVQEADSKLDDDTDMFVLEIDGDARGYPRDWMQLPHIVGDNIAGQDTVMTYCALSNLPMAFNPKINGKDTDFKVIAQVHNNLIFSDRNSGELIQQVTATAEYSQEELDQYPVQRMPWSSYKKLYPKGEVFNYEPNWYDKLTLKLFDSALAPHYEGSPMFPTLSLADDRLESGTVIWGIKVADETLAITKDAFTEQNIRIIKLEQQHIAFVFYAELDTIGAFYITDDIHEIDNLTIDAYGNSPFGKLQRVNLYSGMPWMIWSHWYPNTQVVSS
ncbi:DUF3179 domain-containing (seleno)protein [Agarivorans sp. MS3-6]